MIKPVLRQVIFSLALVAAALVGSAAAASDEGQAPSPAPLLNLQDQVIKTDTTWSGTIIIEGVVVIGRAATLTIAPGTAIRFRKIDRDLDGTGDSELRVLGGIIAEGVADKPITFASAEPEPAPRDWSYLLIYTSGRLNRLNFCEFRHGFSGLQVQFSTASVKNSLFTNNNEGLRFGRADLAVENNRFVNNSIGIRFTRMEGPVLIRNNEITGNRIGIFLVPSGQNIRDFFEPDRGGRAWNTGRLEIGANNIHDNLAYNLSLGEKQLWNLDMSGNYWGTDQGKLIEATIFDRHRDESLGKVIYKPCAAEKIPEAGPIGADR
ncbi:MAG: right-handed parallel beta-helix repeat-containing protein [Desulfobulbales bacterium]|nr:right-handed parallel beta-helix repeat-containing protein [Desulfobulbales bacterium]